MSADNRKTLFGEVALRIARSPEDIATESLATSSSSTKSLGNTSLMFALSPRPSCLKRPGLRLRIPPKDIGNLANRARVATSA